MVESQNIQAQDEEGLKKLLLEWQCILMLMLCDINEVIISAKMNLVTFLLIKNYRRGRPIKGRFLQS